MENRNPLLKFNWTEDDELDLVEIIDINKKS